MVLNPAKLSAELSNRRFKDREVAAPIENDRVSDPAYKEVGSACEHALTLWPAAKAAILFGSRARSDNRDDSDWDVAFVTQKDESPPDAFGCVFELLREHSK